LADGPAGNEEVRQIADELWGPGPLAPSNGHQTGAGRMLWGMTPAQALALLDTPPDFEPTGDSDAGKILYAHRRTADGDIYFVANHQPHAVKVTAAFRVSGRVPERWDPDIGTISGISNWHEDHGRTEVPLTLEAEASTFVIFQDGKNLATPPTLATTEIISDMPELLALTGPWNLRFTPGWGAPEQVTFPNLVSWTDFADDGVRHYSGSATYTKTFDLPAVPPGKRVMLDLGDVKVLAAVKLNGQDLGVVWKAPYALDVTKALKPGSNTLEVRVVNTWTNRLIADAGLPPEKRLTWANYNPEHPGDALKPSGLLGPVVLRTNGG
jgi:hypothetical protein